MSDSEVGGVEEGGGRVVGAGSEDNEQSMLRMKYEDWLILQEAWLSDQIRALEQQVGKLRKTKKSLSAKQRVVSRVFKF